MVKWKLVEDRGKLIEVLLFWKWSEIWKFEKLNLLEEKLNLKDLKVSHEKSQHDFWGEEMLTNYWELNLTMVNW